MLNLTPLTRKKIKRFKEIKRGYWSFLILSVLLVASLFAEVFVNSKALVVKYQYQWFFPVVSDVHLAETFGQTHSGEANYRELAKSFATSDTDDFILMPIVPWNPYEQDFSGDFPPTSPNAETQHYLGTDVIGRDILARLVYGFRIAMGFALLTIVSRTRLVPLLAVRWASLAESLTFLFSVLSKFGQWFHSFMSL